MSRQLFISVLSLLAVIGLTLLNPAVHTYAQNPSPTPSPRDILINEIKDYAERHIQSESPMQTQLVVDMFRDNSVGLTPQEIAKIYEEEYSYQKAAINSNPWKLLQPKVGWIVAGILFVLLILRGILTEWVSSLIKAVSQGIYNNLAGTPFFRRTALRHYQQALIGRYQRLHIPFRPDRPLKTREIFVPLKVSEASDEDQIDAYHVIADHKRLMVTGRPGSGKSMLLKSIALTYAEGRLVGLPEQPVTILLELSRFNESDAPVKDHLVEILQSNDFPHAKNFVNKGLVQGTLMLLLDGLDEINSHKRWQIVNKIKDFLDEYKNCRVIITCRTAVYKQEFTETVDRTLEIVEFSDQQIRRFIDSWVPEMPPEKSTEQLMQTLYDRPRIMALARNPLMLTIIAYLYTDTPYVLPHSRAEFYRQSTDVLLRQWHQEHNQYEARDKRLILQYLALFIQENAAQRQQDRRSIEYQSVLTLVQEVLPDLNLNPQDAKPLLNEIVERSGLLLLIDGGQRYQFAHLTLQEFFSAAALIDDVEKMIAYFRNDPDTWYETIKLWCGLARDSTTLIGTIFTEHPIIAFECLSDAQQVDSTLADKIITTFKTRLNETDNKEAILRAFSAVASDLRPRGKIVFEFLEQILGNAEEPELRLAAGKALSLTNLPKAAYVLSKHFVDHPQFHSMLIRMGDLAVPPLVAIVERKSTDVLNDLQAIGTPNAIKSLVDVLWHTEQHLNSQAAWHLATLLSQSNVENMLRTYPLTNEQRNASRLDWVWQPFTSKEPIDSALPIIAGRIAYLIDKAPPRTTAPMMPPKLDPRLIIPLCSIEPNRAKKILHLNALQYPLSVTNASPAWLYLLASLPPKLQLELTKRLSENGIPTYDDWRNIFRQMKYEFKTGWHYRVICTLAVVISLIAFGQMAAMAWQSSRLINWSNIFILVAALLVIAGWLFFWVRKFDPAIISGTFKLTMISVITIPIALTIILPFVGFMTLSMIIVIPFIGLGALMTLIILVFSPIILPVVIGHQAREMFKGLNEQLRTSILEIVKYLLVVWLLSSPMLLVAFFVILFLLSIVSWQLTGLIWLALLGIGITLWWRGLQCERAAQRQNPLQGILELQADGDSLVY